MDYLKKMVGKKIKEARKLAGFKTQSIFAEQLGTDTGTVGRWEAGINFPSQEFWQKIEHVTGKKKIWFQSINKENSTDLASIVAEHAGELRQTKINMLAWELDLDPDKSSDSKLLKQLLPVLPYIKKIPPDILSMLAEEDEVYFDHLRKTLELFSEKRSQKKTQKKTTA